MGTQVGPRANGPAVVLAMGTRVATARHPPPALPGGGLAGLRVACALVLAVLLYTLPAAVDGRAA
jgi:hypothetical protein